MLHDSRKMHTYHKKLATFSLRKTKKLLKKGRRQFEKRAGKAICRSRTHTINSHVSTALVGGSRLKSRSRLAMHYNAFYTFEVARDSCYSLRHLDWFVVPRAQNYNDCTKSFSSSRLRASDVVFIKFVRNLWLKKPRSDIFYELDFPIAPHVRASEASTVVIEILGVSCRGGQTRG